MHDYKDTDAATNECSPPAHWLADERQLRLECVRLGGGVVGVAEEILAFVTGQSDKRPLEKITDALRQAGVK